MIYSETLLQKEVQRLAQLLIFLAPEVDLQSSNDKTQGACDV